MYADDSARRVGDKRGEAFEPRGSLRERGRCGQRKRGPNERAVDRPRRKLAHLAELVSELVRLALPSRDLAAGVVHRSFHRGRASARLHRESPGGSLAALDDARLDPRGPADDRVCRCERVRRTDKPRDEPIAGGRDREDFERGLNDHAKRAERSHEDLIEVVSRHVLDDAPARPRDRPVGERDARPDEQIAHGAITSPPDAIGVRGDHASDGRLIGVRGIQRQELTRARENSGHVRDAHPRPHGHREISRLVVDHAREPRRADLDVCRRDVADVRLRP